MERKISKRIKYRAFLIAAIFIVGIIGHLISSISYLMIVMTPLILFIVGVLVIYTDSGQNPGILIRVFIIFISTLILEIIGIKTGLVFGEYSYTEVLGPAVLGTPLVIGLNWTVLILGANGIGRKIVKNHYLSSFFAAIILVLFDYIMEPVAIKLNYWQWQDSIIPLQNYAAWFVISFGFSFFISKVERQTDFLLASFTFMSELIFFLSLLVFL